MKLLQKICIALALGALILSLQWQEKPAIASLKTFFSPALLKSASASKSSLGQEPSLWLKTEARRMNQADPHPESTARELEQAAAELSLDQMQALAATVLNQQGALNERLLALHLLRLNRNSPSEIYEKIALLEDAASDDHHSQPVEIALAFSALEEIQLRSLADRQEIARIIRIGQESKNPKLAFLLPQILAAAENQKPFYLEAQK